MPPRSRFGFVTFLVPKRLFVCQLLKCISVPFAPETRLSPSRRFLYVREEKLGTAFAYILDLTRMERIKVSDESFSSFLTDDLWFVENGLEDYIFDQKTGTKYPIQKFVYSNPEAEINGETNLFLLAESLRQAKDVFLIGASTDTVVALVSDFHTRPERNFTADRFDIPDFDTEQFLQANHIAYRTILPDFPDEVLSPDGRFIARADGIYLEPIRITGIVKG